jgi:hypothetical protein
MIRTLPLQLDGRIVGVTIGTAAGVRFLPLDPRLADLDGAGFPDAEEAQRVAVIVLARECGRGGAATPPPLAA